MAAISNDLGSWALFGGWGAGAAAALAESEGEGEGGGAGTSTALGHEDAVGGGGGACPQATRARKRADRAKIGLRMVMGGFWGWM